MCVVSSTANHCFAVGVHQRWGNSLKPQGKTGPKLTLARGGRTEYVVLLPAKPTTQDVKAASDLTRWLKEMSGANLPVVRETDNQPVPGKVISLGRTTLLGKAGLPEAEADLGDEGYAIAVQGKTLYLWGGKRRGPINAVYA
ncbi:MAG: hypothetical protein HY646_07060, partial [Acidobacteria bacterium]|nr:hypothetical protein [Acidobacteriota bacterium]